MENQKLIFVCGTGRSGTHLVGRCIASHPDVEGRIEEPETFNLITQIATSQDFISEKEKQKLHQELQHKLQSVLQNSSSHILEKSHPSLWLMESLIHQFPNAQFICVYRDLEPTVSSMIEHKGILNWYQKLPQNKVNRFLGITSENAQWFADLSIEEKCALRWKSHFDEIQRLSQKYTDKIYAIKYDDFLLNPTPILSEIALFLNLTDTYEPEEFKIESLDKWKHLLTKHQVEKIKAILN